MFQYFIDTAAASLRANQIPPALAYAFDGLPLQAGVTRGPSGRGGLILADRSLPAHRLGYYPDRQQWRPGVGSQSGFWIGLEGTAPTVEQLARPAQLPGKEVADSSGRLWLIPYARNFLEWGGDTHSFPALPTRFALDHEGRWTRGQVIRQHARLWELVQGYDQALAQAVIEHDSQDGDTVRFTYDAIDELAIVALQTNYRLGALEADWLELYDEAFREQVIGVVRGLPLLDALKKKRGPIGGDSSLPAAGSPTDSPPDSLPANGNTPAVSSPHRES